MRASPEVRQFMNRLRRRFASKNGVIQSGLLDIPWLEAHESKNVRSRIRRKAMLRPTLISENE